MQEIENVKTSSIWARLFADGGRWKVEKASRLMTFKESSYFAEAILRRLSQRWKSRRKSSDRFWDSDMKKYHLVAYVKACARIVSHNVMANCQPLLEGSVRKQNVCILTPHLFWEVLNQASGYFTKEWGRQSDNVSSSYHSTVIPLLLGFPSCLPQVNWDGQLCFVNCLFHCLGKSQMRFDRT